MKSLQEVILEAISNTWLFEMAYSREKYIDRLMGIDRQIVENWCLIKYCNMYDEENYNRLHWSKELISHLTNACNCKLKKGLNKLKTTNYVFVELNELDDLNTVDIWIEHKWDVENLPDDKRLVVANEFVKALPKLCQLMATGTYNSIKQYVYNEI